MDPRSSENSPVSTPNRSRETTPTQDDNDFIVDDDD